MSEIKQISVLGSGIMGHGIAQVAAQVGKYDVTLYDIEQGLIDKGLVLIRKSLQNLVVKGQISGEEMAVIMKRIRGTSDMSAAVSEADLVIEAVTESAPVKKELFQKIDRYIKSDTIVSTNTSAISITELASVMNQPQNFCGLHFFNPPQIIKLVEVIRGARTSSDAIQIIMNVAQRMGKEPVYVKKDSPGFIVNRILMPALNEAVELYSEGVADRDDIDKAIKLGLNWPVGPLMLIDYIGVDTTLAIAQVLEREMGSKFRPSDVLKRMVQAKKLGKKTAEGFYDWAQK